ncbi:AraC family transcriptional regulator [Trinickia sp. NRRL B-1857]|uniref:helix-turn-helix transcriptional regulator n=1 Tax=Trinickia sp. NRRL B-1857 TaxID=3162879 RepID=UPI003D27232B
MKIDLEEGRCHLAAPCEARQIPWLSCALRILRSDLAAELSMSDVAASVNQSTAHFFRTFRLTVGQTPHQWRLNVRIAAAQSDLIELPLCTAEIAHKYGFSDQAHFTRIFRRIVGQTPGAWRRIH